LNLLYINLSDLVETPTGMIGYITSCVSQGDIMVYAMVEAMESDGTMSQEEYSGVYIWMLRKRELTEV
jgi:hypothetical protein